MTQASGSNLLGASAASPRRYSHGEGCDRHATQAASTVHDPIDMLETLLSAAWHNMNAYAARVPCRGHPHSGIGTLLQIFML